MKKVIAISYLVLVLLSMVGCASDTATSQKEKKPTDWGTVNTIETESRR
jgi:hypothetical protein